MSSKLTPEQSEERRIRRNARSRQEYAENKEEIRSYRKAIYDPQKAKRWAAADYQKRKSVILEKHKAYRASNSAKCRQLKQQWILKNKDAHLARYAEYESVKRATIKQATPTWANRFFIREIYILSRLRSRLTGVKHHVDHIIPLQSPLVCGLHVESNLQVIPATENIRKSNHLMEYA